MPCGQRNHKHPPWPQEGAHEFVIEACENHCGWCNYETKSANNLRTHARRHVANKNDTTLRRIKIVKGKAGRKKVKVTRQFLPSSGNYHENPSRSTSADRLDERMKVEGSNRDGLNFFCDPNENHSAFLKRPDHSQSPLSESTSKMEGTLMIPNSPEYDSGLPGLNSRAREAIYEGILQPLLDRQYLKVFHGYLAACSTRLQTKEIICLRDLEEMLLLETCAFSTSVNVRTDFWLSVVQCVKATVPFLSDSELVRATDKPYSERYFTNLRESAKIAQQFQAAEEKEDDIDRGADQEQQEVSHSTKQAATIDGAETRARSVPKQLEHQLGERQEQEEQNTDEPLPEVHEIASNTGDRIWPEPRGSNTQRSVQDAVSLSGQSDEAESAQHQRPNSQQLNRANLKELGYNQTQAGIIVAGPLMSVRLTDMRPEPTSSPPAGSSSEVQRMCLPRLRIQSINLIHKTILLPLLRKSSLKHFSLLVLAFSRMIYTPEIGSLRDLELLLTSNARIMAKSSTQYLRFCNYLLLCTKRTMDYLEAGVGILSDAVGARPDQAPYSDGYFMDTFARIHKESYDMDGVSDGKEGFAYDCPACGFVRMVPRLEFLLVHLQDYHNEDVGCTVEEESVGRSIHPRSWRCSQCLINNEPVYGWVCEFCMVFCEQSRINARIKLLEKVTSKRPDTNTMRKDLTPAQAFPIASSQPIQKEVTSLPGIFPSGIESHAFPRQPPLPQTQTSDTIILNAVTTVMGRGPNSGETGHRGGSVGSRQPSHLELATFELYCLETGCALRFKTSAQLEIHLEESHKLSDNMLMGW